MSTTTPQQPEAKNENMREVTRKTLSKYTSDQLKKKLEENKLVGTSKEVAEEIIKKRSEGKEPEVLEKGPGWSKDPKKFATAGDHNTETSSKKDTKKPVVKKEKTPKVKKEKVAVELIDESSAKVKAVLSMKDASKTDKIKGLLKLGYSPLQISKTSLKAHYSFIHTIKGKMK